MMDDNGYLTGFNRKGDPSITLVACGDTAFVRGTEKKLLDRGPEALWQTGMDMFRQADIAVANLECPVSDRGEPFKDYPPNFRARPETLSFLVESESGFDVVGLANNHILDHGPEALMDTIRLLSKKNVHAFGAGPNQESAREPLIIERQGIKIGFLGFTEWGPFGAPDTPGPCRYSEKLALNSIALLKPLVDIVVVSVHFGFEFVNYPPPHHVASCRRFIDQGVNIVLGHHPHQPQGIEVYRGGVIAYSLGNFLFDMGNNAPAASKEALVLRCELTREGVAAAQIVPYRMNSEQSLHVLENTEKDKALDYYRMLSNPLREPVSIRQEWYNTVRHYAVVYLKSLWHNTVRLRQVFFPLRFLRLFFGTAPNRRLLSGLAGFLISGYCFRAEFRKVSMKLQRRRA